MKRNIPDQNLLNRINNCLQILRERNIKRSREYAELKAMLLPQGYKAFDVFTHYNYLAGSTKGDWAASIKLAAYVAKRKKVS